MTSCRVLLAGLALAIAPLGESVAQEGLGGAINPGRDCQTITTCQFKKGGAWRGCVSSYSCRTCVFVASSCQVGDTKAKRCFISRCAWG